MLKNIDDNLFALQEVVDFFNQNQQDFISGLNFFEIAGFPSRENVFSNILKFYLDTRNPHGFGSSVLKCLLPTEEQVDPEELVTTTIRREVTTEKYNRIDLLIETNGYVILIENKVYHVLNNDLNDYSNYLTNNYPNRKQIKIVLNLFKHSDNIDENGFRFVSYRSFLNKLEKELSQISLTDRYQVLFKEFILNLKNHFSSMMTNQQLQFLIDNEESIKKIKDLYDKSNNYLNSRVSEIVQLVNLDKSKWDDYQEVAYSFEYHSQSKKPFVKVALTLELSNMYLEVSPGKEVYSELKDFLDDKLGDNFKYNKDWLYVKEYKPVFKVGNEKVAEDISKILKLLEEFIIMHSV